MNLSNNLQAVQTIIAALKREQVDPYMLEDNSIIDPHSKGPDILTKDRNVYSADSMIDLGIYDLEHGPYAKNIGMKGHMPIQDPSVPTAPPITTF